MCSRMRTDIRFTTLATLDLTAVAVYLVKPDNYIQRPSASRFHNGDHYKSAGCRIVRTFRLTHSVFVNGLMKYSERIQQVS